MSRQIKLDIRKPCSEKFETFSPTNTGGFCQSCQKEVIDFRSMSDREILDHFSKDQQKSCGYFRQSQLKSYTEIVPPKRKRHISLFGAGLMGISIFAVQPPANSLLQNIKHFPDIIVEQKDIADTLKPEYKTADKNPVVEGIILGESNEPMQGASVVVKGTTIGCFTDEEGRFSFSEPLKEGDVLIISFVGYETQEIYHSLKYLQRIENKHANKPGND